MKHLIILLTASILMGCNKPNPVNGIEPTLLGDWIVTSYKTDGIENVDNFDPSEKLVYFSQDLAGVYCGNQYYLMNAQNPLGIFEYRVDGEYIMQDCNRVWKITYFSNNKVKIKNELINRTITLER